jgi:hypothetical protein
MRGKARKMGDAGRAVLRESLGLGQFLQQLDGMLRQRALLSHKKMIGIRKNDQSLGFGEALDHICEPCRWGHGIARAAEKELWSMGRFQRWPVAAQNGRRDDNETAHS